MKLALALPLFFLAPGTPVLPPQASTPAVEVRARVLDARTLEVVRSDHSGERRSELTLADLPPGARLHAADAAPFQETGLVLALVIEVGDGFVYRYVCQRQGDQGGAHVVLGTPEGVESWWLSGPLFADKGAPYRIVEVHNPGADSLELTFRRGVPSVRLDEVRLDEVVVDECPSFQSSGRSGWVHVIRAQGRHL